MSALAARRAAAASKSSPQTATKAISATPKAIPATPKPNTRQVKRRPTPEQSSVHLGEPSDESSSSPTPPPSIKRARIEAPQLVKERYFAATPASTSSRKGKSKRTFSPSAPASDVESEKSQISLGSSVEEGEDENDAVILVDEGRVRWSGLSTPASTPGPSRVRIRAGEDAMSSSRFEPKMGVKLHALSSEQLEAAGMEGVGPGMIVSLGRDETLMIAGMYTITPLQLPLSLLSTTLYPSSSTRHPAYPVVAPTSHPIPIITPSHTPTSASRTPSQILSALSLPTSFLLKDSNNTLRTIFLIREHPCGLDGLRKGAVPGFTHILPSEPSSWGLQNVHPVIGSFSSPVYPHITPDSWTVALSSCGQPVEEDDDPGKPVIALIKGAKRAGKSTFGRSVLNTLLEKYEKCVWLECDLGQGEFGCGGVVGIWIIDRPVLGPPFTHPQIPERAHYLGTYTPLTCPDEYLAAVQHLLNHYRYEIQYALSPSSFPAEKITETTPLVINTQGWIKGLGEELLLAIEESASPSHVFAFEQPVLENGYDEGGGWTNSPTYPSMELPNTDFNPAKQIFTLEPAPISPLQARYTPADLRILSTISYFHANQSMDRPTMWDFGTSPLGMRPWQVKLGSGISHVYLIGEGSDGVVLEDLHLALNGAIVSLCEMIDPSILQNPEEIYLQGRTPPPNDSINHLGLALIRAVKSSPNPIPHPTRALRTSSTDPSSLSLQLITPLPPSILSRATIMIKNGAIELPTCGMLDWQNGVLETGMAGREWGEVPFLDVGGFGGVGGERRRFRRNLQRKGM